MERTSQTILQKTFDTLGRGEFDAQMLAIPLDRAFNPIARDLRKIEKSHWYKASYGENVVNPLAYKCAIFQPSPNPKEEIAIALQELHGHQGELFGRYSMNSEERAEISLWLAATAVLDIARHNKISVKAGLVSNWVTKDKEEMFREMLSNVVDVLLTDVIQSSNRLLGTEGGDVATKVSEEDIRLITDIGKAVSDNILSERRDDAHVVDLLKQFVGGSHFPPAAGRRDNVAA